VQRGGIIAYPTEAVFGLGCLATDDQALDRLIEIKGRDSHKGFIVVASELEQLSDFIEPPAVDLQHRLDQDWPGPVTWILPARPQTSGLLTGGRSTLAVRVSDHPTVRALCDLLDKPLVSTSANLTGEPELRDAESVLKTFGTSIDGIVNGTVGDLEGPTPIFDGVTRTRLR